jgi:DnaJ-class molecular chaperone
MARAEEKDPEDACERCAGEGAHPWPDFDGVWSCGECEGTGKLTAQSTDARDD